MYGVNAMGGSMDTAPFALPSGFTFVDPYATHLAYRQVTRLSLGVGDTVTISNKSNSVVRIYVGSDFNDTGTYIHRILAGDTSWTYTSPYFDIDGATLVCRQAGDYCLTVFSGSGADITYGSTVEPTLLSNIGDVFTATTEVAKHVDDVIAEPLGILTGFAVFVSLIFTIFKIISWR